LFSLAVCIGSLHAQAQSPSKLDEFFQGLQTLQADFRQQLRDSEGRLIEESQGTLAIRRPDRFRWDYLKPHEQVIVADGKRLWLHDVDLEQVTVRPMAQSLAGTPASLLSGSDDLRATFNIEGTETKNKASVVTLVPKRTDTDFKRVRIRFSGKQLDSMELTDTLGQSTTLEFTAVRRNASIDDARFVFSPPPGADVIGSVAGTP
jgi:outer membrane lipoprotein carrier protein